VEEKQKESFRVHSFTVNHRSAKKRNSPG